MKTLQNHITLIGNMGNKPFVTNFENGSKVVRFSLATNEGISRQKKKTNWHRVFAWGNIASFIEKYGEKGKRLAVYGRLVNRTYLSKTGKKLTRTEVEVKHVIGL